MALPPPAEGSAEVANRVAAARARQVARGVRSNAELEGERLEHYATPDEAGRKLLLQAAEKLRLSARDGRPLLLAPAGDARVAWRNEGRGRGGGMSAGLIASKGARTARRCTEVLA